MIVTVLHERVRPRRIVMHIGAGRRVVIVMVGRHLLVLSVAIIGAVLRANGRWACSG